MPEQQKAFNLQRCHLDALMPKTVVVEYELTIDQMVTFFERRNDPEEAVLPLRFLVYPVVPETISAVRTVLLYTNYIKY